MATVLQPFDSQAQQQQNQQSQQQQPSQQSPTSAGPIQAAGASSGGGTQSLGPTQSTSTPYNASSPTNSGSYVNLQKYMSANQNFDQNQGGFGGAVAGNINQQSGQAQQNTQAAQSAFQNQATGNFNQATQNQGIVGQALANPTQFLQNNPNGAQQFQSDLNARYTGPSSLQSLTGNQNYTNIQNQAQAAQQAAAQTTSETGRMNLLNQLYGGANPQYSQGQQTLDQMFLQNSPQAQQQFAGAQQQANTAAQGLTQAQQQAQGMAQGYTQQIGQMAQGAQQQLTGAGTTLQNTIAQQVAAANAAAPGQYQSVQSALGTSGNANYNLTPAMAAQLGVSGSNTYGVNLNPYLSQSGQATAANVANANQYATFGALQQLAGADTQYGPTGLNMANAAQAGTYSPYAFQTAAANAAIQNNQNQYNTAMAGGPLAANLQNGQGGVNVGNAISLNGNSSQQQATNEINATNADILQNYNQQMAQAQYMSPNQAAIQPSETQAAINALRGYADVGTQLNSEQGGGASNSGINSAIWGQSGQLNAENVDLSKIQGLEGILQGYGNNGSYGQYSW